ncbi:MAG: aminotransferase class III-fold pyridoxal phosphate-dependent enzyme [Chloroflexi bacterium]|nr:MAG: aminotransferase class III-fold pyridoxal phosphate-dependent enzyme [Chloroflexota bacterium]
MFTTERSKAMLEESRRYLAGGVGSHVRAGVQPYPIFMDHGQGSHVFDVDGNEYIDYLLAYGPLILGHCPRAVVEAVGDQLERGTAFGTPHAVEIELSKLICSQMPAVELVRYNSTGSEAVQSVLRLARAYTGKNKIVKFEGHYHGCLDNVYISHLPEAQSMIGLENAPWAVLGSPGQSPSVLQDVIVLPWNNLDIVDKTVRQCKHEIAAILTEPVMSNCGVIPPNPGYLEGLRQIATDNDVLLIFDEVITAFRIDLHGAQGYYGVTPDLCTMAKAMGGGYPISAFGGKQEIMQLLADRKVVHDGTYNSNGLVCAAALATLSELSRDNGAVYARMRALGTKLMNGLAEIAARNGVPLRIQGFGTFFGTVFIDRPITNFRQSFFQDKGRYPIFRRELFSRGVQIFASDKGLWYLSAAHTDADIDHTLEIVEEVMPKLSI